MVTFSLHQFTVKDETINCSSQQDLFGINMKSLDSSGGGHLLVGGVVETHPPPLSPCLSPLSPLTSTQGPTPQTALQLLEHHGAPIMMNNNHTSNGVTLTNSNNTSTNTLNSCLNNSLNSHGVHLLHHHVSSGNA